MTVGGSSDPGGTGAGQPVGRLDNGLIAVAYVPLTDVDPPIAPHLLTALGRARIPAYLATAPMADGSLRLYVSSEERSDARTIVAAVVRAAGGEPALPDAEPPADPLAGLDTDTAFAELVADWHVDTHTAIRDAEKALSREDEDWRARLEQPPAEPTWLDEDHYVPPPPPPLPRFAAPTIMAMALLAVSILLLGLGGQIGLASGLTMLLGVGGVLLGAAMLIMRLRARRDDDDDGAIL